MFGLAVSSAWLYVIGSVMIALAIVLTFHLTSNREIRNRTATVECMCTPPSLFCATEDAC